jgi:Na+/H+ antiporter NhaD/arsenite permease-like protein
MRLSPDAGLVTALASAPPAWTVVPFAAYLVAIAVVPLLFGRFWTRDRNKLLVALLAGLPVAVYLLGAHGGGLLLESLKEYATFLVLLSALFVISGGIHLRGAPAGTPGMNTLVLALGAVLSSVIGTTGASMLLIRPFLRGNEGRRRRTHLVVFFIFIVSNAGGLLTPLGDPPLFLGFLRGVPFLWTLRLAAPWAVANGALLALLYLVDRVLFQKEGAANPAPPGGGGAEPRPPLRIDGGLNALWLLGVIGINSGVGYLGRVEGWSEDLEKLLLVLGMGGMAGLSLATTAPEARRANRFTWGPLREVGVIFLGIFVTMVPALQLLNDLGQSDRFRVDHPWQFFWASGALSSVLDNAPAYLAFASLASGVVGGLHGVDLDPGRLDLLLGFPEGARFLMAVSLGSVLMGANTYIGNGPNFMVKAIAEGHRVTMPSFFGYLAWSLGILVPLYLVLTVLFLRG